MLPTEVSALTRACVIPDTPDVAFINARFDGGAIAHLELSLALPEQAAADGDRRLGEDDRLRRHERRAGADLRLGRIAPRPRDVRRVPADVPHRRHRLAEDRGDRAARARDPRLLRRRARRHDAAVVGAARPRRRPGGRGRRPLARAPAAPRSRSRCRTPSSPRSSRSALRAPSPLFQRRRDRRAPGRDRTSIGTAVLGGGPAGLTAAYVLAQRGEKGVVLEADTQVGGISKTVEVDGYRFDLGGHRFFSKLAPVQKLWEDMMGDEFLDAAPPLADLLQRPVLRLPADGEGRRRPARPLGVDALRALVPLGAGGRARTRPTPSRSGSRSASASGSTTRSSGRTRRRYGGSRARRSGRSGRRSGSRTSRCSRRCSRSSACAATTSRR